jgi:formylglycine-generating enzyme required for sulfatase activity
VGGVRNHQGDSGPPPPAQWVRLPAGSFTMGSPTLEPCRGGDEIEHRVTLRKALRVWPTEVTQTMFESLMGYNPATFGPNGMQPSCTSGSCPVEEVTWHEATAYCNALSASESSPRCYVCTGKGRQVRCGLVPKYAGPAFPACPGYRLPTEAEWEYAYRAGSVSAFYNGEGVHCGQPSSTADAIAWHKGNASGSTHPVATKLPNSWGLYDMAGNVWEWTNDWGGELSAKAVVDPVGPAKGLMKVMRGGSWSEALEFGRAANRGGFWTEARGNYVGFRCVQTAP